LLIDLLLICKFWHIVKVIEIALWVAFAVGEYDTLSWRLLNILATNLWGLILLKHLRHHAVIWIRKLKLLIKLTSSVTVDHWYLGLLYHWRDRVGVGMVWGVAFNLLAMHTKTSDIQISLLLLYFLFNNLLLVFHFFKN